MTLTFEYTLDTGAGLYPQVIHTSDNLLRFIYLTADGTVAGSTAGPVLGLYDSLTYTEIGRISPDEMVSYPSIKKVAHYGAYGFWSAEGDHRFVMYMLPTDICGKNYRRKTTPYNVVWCCSTYNTKGKKYCTSKSIPEATLKASASEVLGLTTFDDEAFTANIEYVDALEDNLLRFVFRNGDVITYRWQDRSRSKSWTDEMREAARQNALRRS